MLRSAAMAVLSSPLSRPLWPRCAVAPVPGAAFALRPEPRARRRTSQRRFRNTLLFVAPDESLLGTARDVMRKAQAWAGSCHLLTLHAWPRAEVAV